MKAILVIEMPNEYADRYNVNEMYVWGLTVQDKHGYEMFDLVTDEPSHLRPLPKYLGFKETEIETTDWHFGDNLDRADGWNACLDAITGETE